MPLQPRSRRGLRLLAWMLGLTALGSAAAPPVTTGPQTAAGEQAARALEETWGIRVLGIRLSAYGYVLDFRYRILDAAKASALMNRRIKPVLTVEGRAAQKLGVPVTAKLGPLRQAPKYPKPDRNYFMFFGNPGGVVRAGDAVTIEIGDFKVEHLIVQGLTDGRSEEKPPQADDQAAQASL